MELLIIYALQNAGRICWWREEKSGGLKKLRKQNNLYSDNFLFYYSKDSHNLKDA